MNETFLTRIRAEALLSSSTKSSATGWWTKENINLAKESLERYLKPMEDDQGRTALDTVSTVIIGILHALQQGVALDTVTIDVFTQALGSLRRLLDTEDILFISAANYLPNVIRLLTGKHVVASMFTVCREGLPSFILCLIRSLLKYLAAEDFKQCEAQFYNLFVELLSSYCDDSSSGPRTKKDKASRTTMMAHIICAAYKSINPLSTLASSTDIQHRATIVHILSALYLYPCHLLSVINTQCDASCAALEAKLTDRDEQDCMPTATLPSALGVVQEVSAATILDPMLFLVLDAGFYYFQNTDSVPERVIVLNVVRYYTQHFFTLWMPLILDLDLQDANIGLTFCSAFLERYRYMHHVVLLDNKSKEGEFTIEKDFFSETKAPAKFSPAAKHLFIYNCNYEYMQDAEHLSFTAAEKTVPNKKLLDGMSSISMKLASGLPGVSETVGLSYEPKPVTITLPHSFASTQPTNVLSSIIYSVILIALTSPLPELRRKALYTAENLFWSASYNVIYPLVGKSGKSNAIRQHAMDLANVLIPLIKERFLDASSTVRETAITIFSKCYHSVMEYLEYTDTLKKDSISENFRGFIVFMENFDELMEVHVYTRPIKSQLPALESPAAIAANEEMIVFSLVQRLNDEDSRVRAVTNHAVQSLYMSGFHKLATSIMQYTFNFGLEGEIEFIKLFHIHTDLSIQAVTHRLLTFFDSAQLSDFTLLIRILARQKMLRRLVENTYVLLKGGQKDNVSIKRQWDESVTGLYGTAQSSGVMTYFEDFYYYMCEASGRQPLAKFMQEGEALVYDVYAADGSLRRTERSKSQTMECDKGKRHRRGRETGNYFPQQDLDQDPETWKQQHRRIEEAVEHLTIMQRMENKWLFLHMFSFPFCLEEFLYRIIKLSSFNFYTAYTKACNSREYLQSCSLTCALLLRSVLIVYPDLFVERQNLCAKFFSLAFEENRIHLLSPIAGSTSKVVNRQHQRRATRKSSLGPSNANKMSTSGFTEPSDATALNTAATPATQANKAMDPLFTQTDLISSDICQTDLATPSSDIDLDTTATKQASIVSEAEQLKPLERSEQGDPDQVQVTRMSLLIIGIHIAILLGKNAYISESQATALFTLTDGLNDICTSTLIDVASTAFALASDHCVCLVAHNLLFEHFMTCPWTMLALYSSFSEWDILLGCRISYRYGIYMNLLRRLYTVCNIVPDKQLSRSWAQIQASGTVKDAVKGTVTTLALSDLAENDGTATDVTQNPFIMGLCNSILDTMNKKYTAADTSPTDESITIVDLPVVLEKVQSLLAVFPELTASSKHEPITTMADPLLHDIMMMQEGLINAEYLRSLAREMDRILILLPVVTYGSYMYGNSMDNNISTKALSYYNALVKAILSPFTIEGQDNIAEPQLLHHISPVLLYDVLHVSTRATVLPIFKFLGAMHTILAFQLRPDQHALQLQTSYTLFMMCTAAHHRLIFTHNSDGSVAESDRIITPTTLFGSKSMQKAILHSVSSTTLRILIAYISFGNVQPRLLGTVIAALASYLVGYSEINLFLVMSNSNSCCTGIDFSVLNSANDEYGTVISISKPYLISRHLKTSMTDGQGRNQQSAREISSPVLADCLPNSTVVKQTLSHGSNDLLKKVISQLIFTSTQLMEQLPVQTMIKMTASTNSTSNMNNMSNTSRTNSNATQATQVNLLASRPEACILVLLYLMYNYSTHIVYHMANQCRISELDAARSLFAHRNGLIMLIDTAILLLLDILLHASASLLTPTAQCGREEVSNGTAPNSRVTATHFTVAALQVCLSKAASYMAKPAITTRKKNVSKANFFVYRTIISIFLHRIQNYTEYSDIIPMDISVHVPNSLFTKALDPDIENDARIFQNDIKRNKCSNLPQHVKDRTFAFNQELDVLTSLTHISQMQKHKLASPSSVRETPRRRVRA